jgi:hypothetical protein
MPLTARTASVISRTVMGPVADRSPPRASRNSVPRFEPRIGPLAPTGGYGGDIGFRVENLDDGLYGHHFSRATFGLSLGGLATAANVGVKPNQVRHGGVIGRGFEGVGHVSPVGSG